MMTFEFQPLIVGNLSTLAKSNALVKAYLEEKQIIGYTIKERIDIKGKDGKIGNVSVLEIKTIANTLLCWGTKVRAPMCSLIALYNSLLLKGIKMTQTEFLEFGVKILPTEGFLVDDRFIENVFSRLKENFLSMKDYELVICNHKDIKVYTDLGMIGKNSILVWNCNEDAKEKGEHFTATVFNSSPEEVKILTTKATNQIATDIVLAVRLHEQEIARAKKLQEEQDAIRKMFPGGW